MDFFYGDQSEFFSFYRIPKLLITDKRFKSLSCEAKLLYGLLIDRMSLSKKNEWMDKQRRRGPENKSKPYHHQTAENR